MMSLVLIRRGKTTPIFFPFGWIVDVVREIRGNLCTCVTSSDLLAFGFGSDFEAKDSGLVKPSILIQTENEPLKVPFPFCAKRLKTNLSEEICHPFPEHTRGVFYWHTKMNLDAIRLRLGNTLTDFELGRDLRSASGVPWELWRIAWQRHGSRPHEALEALNAEDDPNPLFSMNQPIILVVSRWSHRVQLVTKNSMHVS